MTVMDGIVRVTLRLVFVKLPGGVADRIFRDTMYLSDDTIYEDVGDIIERKLQFMDMPSTNFTIFHVDRSGDRVVVDGTYFTMLAQETLRVHRAQQPKFRSTKQRTMDAVETPPRPLCLGSESQLDDVQTRCPSVDQNDDDDNNSRRGSEGRYDRSSSSIARSPPGGAVPDVVLSFEVESRRPASAVESASSPRSLGGQNPIAKSTEYQLGAPRMAHPPTTLTSTTPGVPSHPATLTAAALNANTSVGAPIRIVDLSIPPRFPNYYVRGIVLGIRFKTPKPMLTVCELDLCDENDSAQQITAVTFDAAIQRGVRDVLRGDRKQVVELRHVALRAKNENDRRFESNAHPLMIRLERMSKIEVVKLLALPLHVSTEKVVSMRENLRPGGVVNVADLQRSAARGTALAYGNAAPGSDGVAPTGALLQQLQRSLEYSGGGGGKDEATGVWGSLPNPSHGTPLPSTSTSSAAGSARSNAVGALSGSSGSNGSGGGVRRTPFNFLSDQASMSSSKDARFAPGAMGCRLQQQQQQIVSDSSSAMRPSSRQHAAPHRGMGAEEPMWEPGVPLVSSSDVRNRDQMMEMDLVREDMRKRRIRKRSTVNPHCILCGIDFNSDEGMARVEELLRSSRRNGGKDIPTRANIVKRFGDQRVGARVREGTKVRSTTRLLPRSICHETFVHLKTQQVHPVHCRCAHLCTSFQRGSELEDIAILELSTQICSLCGQPGAFVSCYHPDCNEIYHAVCAEYSLGYVNFGKKDPFMPCPACPRHTQVIEPKLCLPRGEEDSSSRHKNAARCRSEGGASQWWEEEGVVFDSAVVEESDLRDPDADVADAM